MTPDRDIELLLDRWLADGPMTASDRVLDGLSERIARQPQTPAWRLRPRSFPAMTTPLRMLAIAAALLAALLGGTYLLGVGGGSAPGPSPTPTPTPTPTAPPASLAQGVLTAGRYRLTPFDAAPTLRIDVDVPAGWQGFPKWALLGPRGTAASNGIGIGFLMPSGLFSDPCHWDVAGGGTWPQQGDISVGPAVDDLVSALRASSAFDASAPEGVTLAGHEGTALTLQLPEDIDFATSCDKPASASEGAYFPWGSAERDGSDLYAQGPGNRWRLTILDVEGVRIVVVVTDYAGTPEADRAAANAILDSMTIGS